MSDPVADFIVVGAGSAGCALAARLAEADRHQVLVLEAGGGERRPWIQIPLGYGRVYYDQRVNWKYHTEPEPALGGERSYWPRGKVVGGSSAINAMVYVRGARSDFDNWARTAPGWSFDSVEPVFRRMEDWRSDASAREDETPARGRGGPLAVRPIDSEAHPICRSFLAAGQEFGLPFNPDYNRGEMNGVAYYQHTIDHGLRASTARAYLRPATSGSTLELRSNAHVTRVLFEGRRAVGVEYRKGRECYRASARKEVVICAGAINSPQLLQLSGIGPADLLKHHEVRVLTDAPAVGRHLQDHLGLDHLYRAKTPTLNQELNTWWGKLRAGLQYVLTRQGPLALSLNQAGGFMYLEDSGAGVRGPDLQLYFSPLSYSRAPALSRPLMSPDPFPGFLLGFNPCQPTSRGTVEIRSPNAADAPRIMANYLSTDHDREQMLAGARLLRRFAAMPALAEIIEEEILPGPGVLDDEAISRYITDHAWTVFHPCCTCRMGTDPSQSVVNPNLQVHGLERLRVADASVFPSITSGNTNAPAIMVGERAADFILGDWRTNA